MYMMTDIPDLNRLKVGSTERINGPRAQAARAPEALSDGPEALINPAEFSEFEAPAPVKAPEILAREEEARIIISLYKVKFPEELMALCGQLDSMALAQMDLSELELLRDRCDK